MKARVIITGLVTLVLIVAGWWTLLYFGQRSLMYPRAMVLGSAPRPPDARQVWIPLAQGQGRVEAWYLPLSTPSETPAAQASPAPLLVFTHGNGELIDFWPAAFAEPRRWGMAVLLVEYPGYGRSGGSPTEQSITAAIVAAYDWAQTQADIDPRRIVAYGRSLGGGAACALAARRPVAGMILESTFTSTRPFARALWAPGFLVRDPFDNLAIVSAYHGPLLVLHGEHDEIIPTTHGRELAQASAHAELHLLPCGHNDCPRSWAPIRAFLERNALLGQPINNEGPP